MKHSLKNLLFIASFSITAIMCSCTKNLQQSSSGTYAENATAKYHLVWSDEFNGTKVDTSKWSFETGGGGWGNNEDEYYQAANAIVSNGKLLITAKRESVNGYNYTSTRMNTKGKYDFRYGKIEARMRLPVVQGLWPAFWMLGANIDKVDWPACGETDIMEHINTENIIYGTIHWDNNGHASYGGNTVSTPAKYHIYSVDWDSAAIRWYIDGVKYHEANILNNINSTEEFHKRFFIILNMAVGAIGPVIILMTVSFLQACMWIM